MDPAGRGAFQSSPASTWSSSSTPTSRFPVCHQRPADLDENIADLAGLTVAYLAYHKSLGGKPAPVIDGLTGDQRFFLAFAQAWRSKIRDNVLRERLVSDVHAPEQFRVSIVRNIDAWYTAFKPQPGDKLYLSPDARVRIW